MHRHRQDDFFVVGLNKSPYFGVGNTNLKIDISMRKFYSLFVIALMVVACDNSDDKVNEPDKPNVPDEGTVLELADGQSADLEFDGFA